MKQDFATAAKNTLIMLFGEPVALSIIYHLGAEAFDDPEVFKKKLTAMLGAGAEVVIKKIEENDKAS